MFYITRNTKKQLRAILPEDSTPLKSIEKFHYLAV